MTVVHRDKHNNVTYRGEAAPGTYPLNVEPNSFYESSNPWLYSELMKWGVAMHSLKLELGIDNDRFYKSIQQPLSSDEEARYVAAIRSVARRVPGTALFNAR